jgi:hypothetical protein
VLTTIRESSSKFTKVKVICREVMVEAKAIEIGFAAHQSLKFSNVN